ncbi:MAG: hypothetical protein IPP33_12975 [Flavobacteriales bacterium]|nr:hypothetical protein [Flavobacteriales bacterium]
MRSNKGFRTWPLACGLWLMAPLISHAQSKPFTNDQAVFLQEITAFLVDADKKEGKPFMEQEFTPAWNGSFFDQAQRTRIVDLANVMLKKRFEAFPGFRDYLGSLVSFTGGGRTAADFDTYMLCLESAAKSTRKQNLTDLIAMSASLFKDNTLFKGASVQWQSSSPQFTFAYDSVPKVIFPKLDLRCLAKGDSAVVRNTSGVYFPTQGIWRGIGGRITWERAGLKTTATFAEWSHAYQVKVKSSEIEVDSVSFNDPYFDKALLGRVTDKVLANVTAEKATYPRFESYDRRKKIRDIMEGIDFEGGFSFQGSKLQGYGTREEPAFLTFYKDKQPFIVTSGVVYTIEPDKIVGEGVAVSIRMDKDSISHPSVNVRFRKDKRMLTIIKNEEGLSLAPFYDSFHELDMHFEELRWKQGDPVVEISNLQGSSQTKTVFESNNFFKRSRYEAMLGTDAVHPLSRLREFSKKVGNDFSATEFAVFTKLQKPQVVPLLFDMAVKRYLNYDPETESVHILPRLTEHVLASAKKTDYDVLQFTSSADDGVNGTINLLNYDLALKGVARIILSDSQDVKIYPSNKEVTVKKGRDFSFGGNIVAGKLTYYGKEYYFHYDPFIIDLLNVDSVSFYADSFEANENGETSLIRVKNVLEKVTGTLEIDEPSNKSGIQQVERNGKMEGRYPAFPKFNSAQESFVFYDRKAIQKGAYLRDKFYYKSDPFLIDSLDNFTNAGLYFPGTLMSGGIFPDIRETLRLQEDYALGFVRYTGDGGLPLYGKKAKFADTLRLDYKGLHGSGDLTFLTTIARSSDLYFTPDTTFGVADTLYNGAVSSASMNVPNVHASNVFIRLEPAKDVLLAKQITAPMVMYDKAAYLHGQTELTPKGMTGAGLIDFTNATLKSRLFQFETMKLHADTSDFRLTEGDTASIAFKTDNVNATVKLDERVGEFVSNGNETKVEFPVNQYMCYMDRFKWFMDQGDLELESDRKVAAVNEDLQLSGSNFISTRADQDSLSFMAPKARYDLKQHLITANEVQYIHVADALITPDSNRVRIRRNAEMDPITNAVITANAITKNHTIYNATVNIKAKRDYNASGDYDYVDETKKAFKFHFANINVDTSYQTFARGRIGEDERFQLSPAFDYYGEVLLQAASKELTFTGSTRILHDCAGIGKEWMRFSGKIDPNEVFIPVGDSLSDNNGSDIGAGIFITSDDPFKPYGTFLSRKEAKADRTVIAAKGLLFFDKTKKNYLIGSKDKIRSAEQAGDLVTLSTESCALTANGQIGTGTELGRVKVQDFGTLDLRGDSARVMAQVSMYIDFFFHENALEKMATDILAYPEQKAVDITKTPYEKGMREMLGKEKSDKLISELSIKGEIKKLPEELVKPLVFADVKLRWNADDQSWQSQGPIGVATILKKPIFRTLKGKIEFQRKRSGDAMHILLLLDEQTYWFFSYTRGQMLVYSSDVAWNTMISELKEDKMQQETKKDDAEFRFMLTGKRKVDEFRDRFGL